MLEPKNFALGSSILTKRFRLLRLLGCSALALIVCLPIFSSSPPVLHSATGAAAPSNSGQRTLTWESSSNFVFLDPGVSFDSSDYAIIQNVYEPLLWYNGSSSTSVIPWLAQNYTISPSGRSVSFTLRKGITFANGDVLNSTDVYFSLNRLLIIDGSFPVGFPGKGGSHGAGAAWIIQQLLEKNLSTTESGNPQSYNGSWVSDVLSENFVQITGPLTFTLNIQNPNSALPVILSGEYADIIDADFVMEHDLALWEETPGYNLPIPILTGNLSDQIREYFVDETATCNTGITSTGCGLTYLDTSTSGSEAGTGPYTIQRTSGTVNVSIGTLDITNVLLQRRAGYWGGASGSNVSKLSDSILTINANYVPQPSTRVLDLTAAARSGSSMIADIDGSTFSNLANVTEWKNQGALIPAISNISIYGPYTSFQTGFITFDTNVTDPSIGSYYPFQPFADYRFRLAFADSVDLYEIDRDYNQGLGKVALNEIPPNLPPVGSFNGSDVPIYRYDPREAQSLLLSAMFNPITTFNFANGTTAARGAFNNTFGCPTLDSNNECENPLTRTITIDYPSGSIVDQQIYTDIANTINNISETYHMGLNVVPRALDFNTLAAQSFAGEQYMPVMGWTGDYPWISDFLIAIYNYYSPFVMHWNTTELNNLQSQFNTASSSDNVARLVTNSNELNYMANREVLFLWTFYPYNFNFITSNIGGFYSNPSLYGVYFATLYLKSPVIAGSSGIFPSSSTIPIIAAVGVVAVGSAVYLGRRRWQKNGGQKIASNQSMAVNATTETTTIPAVYPSSLKIDIATVDTVRLGSRFEFKLSLSNKSSSNSTGKLEILEIAGVLPAGIEIVEEANTENPEFDILGQTRIIRFRSFRLLPDESRTIVFELRGADNFGNEEIIFAPTVTFLEQRIRQTKEGPRRVITIEPTEKIILENEKARTVLNYLISAFTADRYALKMSLDNSGWRTLGQISRESGVPYFSVYGRKGGYSPEVKELFHEGLLATRVFSGERGRGGEITKIRIEPGNQKLRDLIAEKR